MSQPRSIPLRTIATHHLDLPAGVRILGDVARDHARILTREALEFVAALQRKFRSERDGLLEARVLRQQRIDQGAMPDFLAETSYVRESDWTIAPVRADLEDRRVEITGPVDRKMIINALNSGAQVFMADFEDSHSPGWKATIQGQANLHDAVRRKITFTDHEKHRHYSLNEEPATLMVRPRGWHLPDKHLFVDGEQVSASLLDFGLFFFHNAQELIDRGSGPYFYLPKLEGHLEARLWNDVFLFAQDTRGIPRGTIKATVLIETILAAFEMDEILFELREHSAGLNCGRWDYIFSFIKKFRAYPEFVLPDRSAVGMDQHFLRSYSRLLIETCHRRGAHAMGGMAAQIPQKSDPTANWAALAKVRADKRREAGDGHDGTWVAHPGLVELAREEFDQVMPGKNQIDRRRDDVEVTAADLLTVPTGLITEAGVRQNLSVGIRYMAAWLSGTGCVPIQGLMEDAATAEICRIQLWQWRRHRARLDDGRVVDSLLLRGLMAEELERISDEVGTERFLSGNFKRAADLFDAFLVEHEPSEFLTLVAYRAIDSPPLSTGT